MCCVGSALQCILELNVATSPQPTQPGFCHTLTHTLYILQSHLALLSHRNMITDGQTKVNNSEVCINDDGFGYASEGE